MSDHGITLKVYFSSSKQTRTNMSAVFFEFCGVGTMGWPWVCAVLAIVDYSLIRKKKISSKKYKISTQLGVGVLGLNR